MPGRKGQLRTAPGTGNSWARRPSADPAWRHRERRTRDRHLVRCARGRAPRFSADRPSTAGASGDDAGVRVNGPTMGPADETMTDVLAEYKPENITASKLGGVDGSS